MLMCVCKRDQYGQKEGRQGRTSGLELAKASVECAAKGGWTKGGVIAFASTLSLPWSSGPTFHLAMKGAACWAAR
eukprot:5661549-Pleurochrysis_carterae.AAC.1